MTIRVEARYGHKLVKRDFFGGLWLDKGTSMKVKNRTIIIDHGILVDPFTLEQSTYDWRVEGYGKDEGGMVGERQIMPRERWVTRKGPIFIGE